MGSFVDGVGSVVCSVDCCIAGEGSHAEGVVASWKVCVAVNLTGIRCIQFLGRIAELFSSLYNDKYYRQGQWRSLAVMQSHVGKLKALCCHPTNQPTRVTPSGPYVNFSLSVDCS